MASKKRTLYEILAVEPNASDVEIQAAYETRTAKLESLRDKLDAEDYTFKAKVLALAFKTLSAPDSRGAYDAQLAAASPPERSKIPLSILPLDPRADTATLQAEALNLRADMAAMRAGVYRPYALAADAPGADLSVLGSTLRRVLLLLGLVFGLIIVMNIIAGMVANRRGALDSTANAKASEKVQLQEYYQTHGVRPANIAELRLLEAEDKRRESEAYAARRELSQQERQDRQARAFEREAREQGERAAAELRYNEQAAAERQRRADQERIYQDKQDQRQREEAERMRLERLKREWNQELWRR